MKRLFMTAVIASCLLMISIPGQARLRVAASTSDLAYFAREIGGDLVEAEAIAHPTADIHFVEVRPSYMIKVRRADVALKVGLELDQWMDQIIAGSRNSELVVVDCSRYIQPIEVPEFEVDARHGDIHRFGNPHYWMTPDNVKPITDAIVEGLSRTDPGNASTYQNNQEQFLQRLQTGIDELDGLIAKLNGFEIVTYHNSWPYFNEFVGLHAAGFIEPYPGVPPSPSHIKDLTALVRERGIRVIGVDPYFDKRVPDRISGETGAAVVTLYPSVGGRSSDETYLDWLRGNLEAIAGAVQ